MYTEFLHKRERQSAFPVGNRQMCTGWKQHDDYCNVIDEMTNMDGSCAINVTATSNSAPPQPNSSAGGASHGDSEVARMNYERKCMRARQLTA